MARPARRPRLGQHFLHDEATLEKIATALPLDARSRVLEIGPGEGALTEHLLTTGAHVIAVELDRTLAQGLRDKFANNDRFSLVESDILDIDFAELIGDRQTFVIGNLPYYITSPIIRRVLPLGDRVPGAAFLIQREVADRIVARKGTRDYGYLSALCRLWSEPKLLFKVKAGSFRPPPRVESAVIGLTLRKGAEVDPGLIRFLEAAFKQPRKTLHNNLSTLYDREVLAAMPEARLRAQQLDVEELDELWRRLERPPMIESEATPS